MEYIDLLRRESGREGGKLLTVASFTGISNAFLVAVIINAAQQASKGTPAFRNLFLFVLCLLSFILARRYTLTRTAKLTEEVISKLRHRIVDKIRHSNLVFFEKIGKAPLYTALTEHTFILSASCTYMAGAFSSAVMLVFAILFIAILSWHAFQLTFICIAAGVFLYYRARRQIDREIKEAGRKENEFFALLDHLLDGFKEIKLHQPRNEDIFHNFLSRTIRQTQKLKTDMAQQFAQISIFSQSFFYILLAVIIFLLPSFSAVDSSKIVPIASVILFIIGPLGEVFGAAPFLLRSNAAAAAIQRIETTLDEAATNSPIDETCEVSPQNGFREILCEQAVYSYESPQGNGGFRVGPIELTITSGELLFIVGGNGSGKSTFLRMLTGLYPLKEGTIRLDGVPVSSASVCRYRSLFSSVFTDFHLFDRLYGLAGANQQKIDELLHTMQIHDKTEVIKGRFTTTHLSTGQRKRLALIVALLEERPILIFDEVAADQDPGFRRYFYEVLLPQLNQSGKTIIAATHDDAYFHVAHRVVKMEYGKLEPYRQPGPGTAPA